ncbi:B-cell receptor-associated 31-like [Euphorbia peplus]|nr:B-cell receptor-associated 31-like [Euphorbia peplus]
MIQLLYAVIFGEMGVILALLFKTPLRKLVIASLDRVKRGRGPVMIKTIGGTIFVVLLASVYSMLKIQNRTIEAAGTPNPTDQVLMSKHMLEASLMGFLLFLALMIDRLHHYIRELRSLRKVMEAAKKQSRGIDDGKNGNAEEAKTLEDLHTLKSKVKNLETECESKAKGAKDAEDEVEGLRKQSEGFLMEYDRLLADNQNLRNQLESMGQTVSQSDGKKNM